jgi:hypothetical protein
MSHDLIETRPDTRNSLQIHIGMPGHPIALPTIEAKAVFTRNWTRLHLTTMLPDLYSEIGRRTT